MNDRLLIQAREGNELAFSQLTAPYRRELEFHCYRMLGSLQDAEDVMQETMLAAWRGLATFEARASLRTWLYRIATNRCLNLLRAANRRIPADPPAPFPAPEPSRRNEIRWLQPYPDSDLDWLADAAPGPAARYEVHETVELAFVEALQRLSPRQRATLVLRDVLGFHTAEVAAMLESTDEAVKGALKRARQAIDASLSDTPARGGSATERELARRFADAFVADDIDGMVALLTEDAVLSMPPSSLEYIGRAAIAEFMAAISEYRLGAGTFVRPAAANFQPAFGVYRRESGVTVRVGLMVLRADRRALSHFIWFINAPYMSRFELPELLDDAR